MHKLFLSIPKIAQLLLISPASWILSCDLFGTLLKFKSSFQLRRWQNNNKVYSYNIKRSTVFGTTYCRQYNILQEEQGMPKLLPCAHGIQCTVHVLGLGKSGLSDANA